MFTNIFNFVVNNYFWTYAVFVAACLIHSVLALIKEAFELSVKRQEAIKNNGHFYQSLTIGEILRGVLYPFIPVVNIIVFIFLVLPDIFHGIHINISAVLNYNLFPEVKPKKVEEK